MCKDVPWRERVLAVEIFFIADRMRGFTLADCDEKQNFVDLPS